jgi:hypothetical protein
VGEREDGEKGLLGMEPGYRESKESWAASLAVSPVVEAMTIF